MEAALNSPQSIDGTDALPAPPPRCLTSPPPPPFPPGRSAGGGPEGTAAADRQQWGLRRPLGRARGAERRAELRAGFAFVPRCVAPNAPRGLQALQWSRAVRREAARGAVAPNCGPAAASPGTAGQVGTRSATAEIGDPGGPRSRGRWGSAGAQRRPPRGERNAQPLPAPIPRDVGPPHSTAPVRTSPQPRLPSAAPSPPLLPPAMGPQPPRRFPRCAAERRSETRGRRGTARRSQCCGMAVLRVTRPYETRPPLQLRFYRQRYMKYKVYIRSPALFPRLSRSCAAVGRSREGAVAERGPWRSEPSSSAPFEGVDVLTCRTATKGPSVPHRHRCERPRGADGGGWAAAWGEQRGAVPCDGCSVRFISSAQYKNK